MNKIFLLDLCSLFFIAFVNYLWSFIAIMLIDIYIFAAESEHIYLVDYVWNSRLSSTDTELLVPFIDFFQLL